MPLLTKLVLPLSGRTQSISARVWLRPKTLSRSTKNRPGRPLISTAPPKSAQSPRYSISPANKSAPMSMSTAAQPRALSGPENHATVGSQLSYCAHLRTAVSTTVSSQPPFGNLRDALGFRVSRSNSWCKTIWSAPGRLLRSRLSSTCKNLSSSAHESSKSGVS
jgi:hypothetical protein